MASAASRWGRSCRTRLCGWCSQLPAPLGYRTVPVSMPHAALWVVQPCMVGGTLSLRLVSMPHAALWVVQQGWGGVQVCPHCCFNAARGFVGGAASYHDDQVNRKCPFQCRTRLCGWCSHRLHQRLYGGSSVSMPHAALWVVQRESAGATLKSRHRFNAARGFVGGAAERHKRSDGQDACFNAARGFVGGAAYRCAADWLRRYVSMPHAALWVVQPFRKEG